MTDSQQSKGKHRLAFSPHTTFTRVFSSICMLSLLFFGVISFTSSSVHAATGEQAASADAFVDSIGINPSLDSGYDKVKAKLLDLGVRHIRTGSPTDSTSISQLNDLAASGIHSTMMMTPGQNINLYPPPAGTPVGKVYSTCVNQNASNCYYIKDYIDQVRPALEQLEGINEFDIFYNVYSDKQAFRPYPNSTYGNTTWYRDLCDYMQQLHDTLRSDPKYSTIPIVSPSIGSNGSAVYLIQTCGDWAKNWVDYDNLHDYLGAPLGASIDNYISTGRYQTLYPNMPYQATESGFTTANGGVSEIVQGKYIPRLYLEQFNHGVKRTFGFNFVETSNDPTCRDCHWGILHPDFTPKPAYTAEKNLISLLSDPGNPIAPGSLDYSITAASSVHHTLLQKRDGTFYLALWNDVASTDSDVTTPVTLNFNTSISQADVYSPNDSTNVVNSYSNPTSLNLNVPDKVLLVKLTPSTLVAPGAGSPPPTPQQCPNYVCPQPPVQPAPPPIGPLPALIVTEAHYSGNPVVGQPITFSGTIKNVGAAPTPDGVITALTFYGPNFFVFNDKYTQSIAPGQSVTLTANTTWTPRAAGRYTITAQVDDLNRIQKSNTNTTLPLPITILSSGNTPVGLQATAGNSANFLDWAGTTSATSYNIKRSTIVSGGTPTSQPPEISGSAAASPSSVNLTAEGTLDWAEWGFTSTTSFDHKAGVTSQISNYSQVNAGYVATYGGGTNFTWSDGTPDATGNSSSGIDMGPYLPDSGFSFTVPADTLPRVLKVYGNAKNFRASISDGSAPDLTLSTDGSNQVFTVIFNAVSSGQTLKVSLTGPQYNHTNLQAATLSGPIALAPFTTIATGVTSNFYQDNNVAPGTTYFYSVSAVTSSGEGPNSNVSAATPLSGTATVTPVLSCVLNNGGGSYTAYFGYNNTGTTVYEVPIGSNNGFSPAPQGRGQPTTFQPGQNATYPNTPFSVDFNGSSITWTLNGQSVTASSSSSPCPFARLFGSEQSAPSTVNLTNEGTLDWAHWGLDSGTAFNHKANVTSQISNFTVVGSGYVSNYTNGSTTVSWSDGTPTASATTGNGTYIGPYVANSGLSITVPADQTPRTLRIYAGVYQAQLQVQAHLSDSIATDYSDNTLNDRIGGSEALYTITYQASKSNQTLTVTLIDATFTGNISLQAATLSYANPLFATDFESASPQPTWVNSVDTTPNSQAGGIRNVTGICCSLKGPETGVRNEITHSGSTALMYSGLDTSSTVSYAYDKVFDLSPQQAQVTVTTSTTLSYWIYPQSHSSNALVNGNNSTCVAIDLIFSDGSDLRDSGAVDQNGNKLHPAHQCNHLTLDTWNHVTSNIGAVVSGKTLVRIDVGYDQPGNTGGYRGYIDDIQITN